MRSLTVTLPDDMVEAIEARVAAGEYASASELVREELGGPIAGDVELDDWLRDVVVPRHLARAADPSPLIPVEDVLGRVQGRFAAKYR